MTHSVWDTPEHTPSRRQRLFLRYLTAVLVDLAVLNLFVQYWEYVTISSFTVSLFTALLLQVLLKLTIEVERRVAAYFNAKRGTLARAMRFFCAWLVLFGSKFLILKAIDIAFGQKVEFGGPFGGLLALIVVVSAMLIAEIAIVRLYRRLA